MRGRRWFVSGVVVVALASAAGIAVTRAARAEPCEDDFPVASTANLVAGPLDDPRLRPPGAAAEWEAVLAQATRPAAELGIEPAVWAVALDPSAGAEVANAPDAVATDGDLVVVAWSLAQTVAAFSPGGEVRWARHLPGVLGEPLQTPMSLAIVDGHVVVAAASGEARWVAGFDAGGAVVACRRLHDAAEVAVGPTGVVVVEHRGDRDEPAPGDTSRVIRYTGPRLERVWAVEAPGWPIVASTDAGTVVLGQDPFAAEAAGFSYPTVRVLDASTGEAWSGVERPAAAVARDAVVAGGKAVALVLPGGYASERGSVQGLGPAGRWTSPAGGLDRFDRVIAAGDAVLVADEADGSAPAAGTLALLDGASGAERWRVDSPGGWTFAQAVLDEGRLFASTHDLAVVDLDRGKVTTLVIGNGAGADVRGVAVSDAQLVVAADQGVVVFPLAE